MSTKYIQFTNNFLHTYPEEIMLYNVMWLARLLAYICNMWVW